MNEKEIISKLEDFGLSINEAKVYLASLTLGSSKVNEISKKTEIIRETTYGIINSLIQKGLMSYVIKSGVKYFEAANPIKLKQILKEKELQINEIFPVLNELKKSVIKKPKIEVYEGKKGLKTIMGDLLKSKTEILTIASNKNLKSLFEYYFPNFVKRRIKQGIKTKLLTDEKVLTKELIEYKYLPKSFDFKTANYIYKDKFAIISLSQKEPIGIIIEDKEIAKSQRNQFNLLWSLIDK